MARSGKYKLKNPNKYKGNPNNVIYRSQWETVLMRYLDNHSEVIEWGSEEIVIPYKNPVKRKYSRYFPDFYVKKKNKEGIVEILIIEVKPYYQTIEPIIKTDKKGKMLRRCKKEILDWAINNAKWDAARIFCEERGWHFIIMDEYSLGIKKK